MYVIILLIFMMGLGIYLVLAWQLARKSDTLWLLSTAVKQELPLPDLIESQGKEIGGFRGLKLQDLADLLREGAPIAVAIDQFRNMLPEQGRLAIRVGGESGTLAECLESASTENLNHPLSEMFNHFYLQTYLAFVINAAAGISFSILYFIVPKYKELIYSFNVETPLVSRIFFSIGDTITGSIFYGGLVGLLLMLMTIWLLMPMFSALNFLERVPRLGTLIRGALAPVYWLRDYLFPYYPKWAVNDVVRYLGVNAAAGRPLLGTLESLARHHSVKNVRQRLNRVCVSVEQGQDIWLGLVQQRFLTPAQACRLQAAEAVDQLPYALKELNRLGESDQYYRREVHLEVLRFVLVILLVCWVALVAIALFAPLIGMIMDHVWGNNL